MPLCRLETGIEDHVFQVPPFDNFTRDTNMEPIEGMSIVFRILYELGANYMYCESRLCNTRTFLRGSDFSPRTKSSANRRGCISTTKYHGMHSQLTSR